jgi:membrane protease YdiL (CAAX protease family)
LWIPWAEELVFRLGATRLLTKFGGLLWGSYFAVILFSMVHTLPTISRLAAGEVGLAIPPLLLGIGCQILYVFSGRIGPAIALHAACNGTIILFTWLDGRWLNWLDFFYM